MNKEYETKLQKFIEVVTEHSNKRLSDMGLKSTVKLTNDRGYKFDKIIFNDKEVRFMVDLKTEIIYGCKSAHQINSNWMFGTLSDVEKWFWGGFHPEPLDSTKIEIISKHGPYKKYKVTV